MKDKSIGFIPIRFVNGEYLFLVIHQTADYWGFPKGHAEAGETELETAKRELCEETGLCQIKALPNFRYVQNYSYAKNEKIINREVVFFVGLVDTTTENLSLQKAEVQAGQWLNYKKALQQLTYKENHKMLKAVQEFLEKEKPQ